MNLLPTLLTFALGISTLLAASPAGADGCYTCGSGSASACQDYCRYSGADTFAARKDCEKRGCKITGTGSCPTAVNYKVCALPPAQVPQTVAASTQSTTVR